MDLGFLILTDFCDPWILRTIDYTLLLESSDDAFIFKANQQAFYFEERFILKVKRFQKIIEIRLYQLLA